MSRRLSPIRLSCWLLCATAALVLPACRKAAPTPSNPPAPRPRAASEATLYDAWDVYYLKGAKIGYGHSTVRRVERNGTPAVETESTNHLEVERFGQPVEQELKLSTLETPAGRLLEFRGDVAMGQTPMVIQGSVEDNQMIIHTQTQGALRSVRIPWGDDIGGFLAIEQSLQGSPMKAGQKRTLRMLAPLLNQIADVELTAHELEATPVLGSPKDLLRIGSVARLSDGNTMNETLWTDPAGKIVKRRIDALGQESFRTSKATAMAEAPAGATFDLGTDTIVKLNKPLGDAHRLRRARYRVELAGGDPAKIFATGPTQAVRSLGPHVAEVTVTAMDAGGKSTESGSSQPVDKAYTTANNMLQIDDPVIRKMAVEARGTETDPRRIAAALERYVHEGMSLSDFTQAFATAAEVAQSRAGDCTEHAVLLAALARACGIPSRIAIGLVYVERSGGFGYHMWTEMYLDGQWVPFDATLGRGGIGGAHLKLVDSSLEGASAYSAFLPVAQVLGQLKIELVDAK